MMYFTMRLSGQAQGDAAGDLNQEQIPLLPSKSQIKTEEHHGVAQVGREPQAWSALSSNPSCSGPCPVKFWSLPRKQHWASCVTAYVWESFSWCKVGTSLRNVYSLFCSCHALLKSFWLFLVTLTCRLVGRCWVLSEITSSPGWILSPSLSSQGKCSSPWVSWGLMLNLPQFISICFVLRGPKTEETI